MRGRTAPGETRLLVVLSSSGVGRQDRAERDELEGPGTLGAIRAQPRAATATLALR
jgi:hypothetical protein